MVFLQVYPEYRSDERYNELKKISIYERQGAFEFFREVFGKRIENFRGYPEDTVTYLLRHTQLLPRQLFIYINAAIKAALKNGNKDITKVDASYIKEAIKNNEELCASEIVDSYSATFPEGKDIMKQIDNLPIIEKVELIKKSWSDLGAKKILSKYRDFPEVIVEADRFIRFLVEIGVIGRIAIDSLHNKNKYIYAEFEYTMPQTLNIKSTDMVAIHPLFTSMVSPERHKDLSPYVGIYPKGIEEDFVIDNDEMRRKYVRQSH
jgi:hypothetical protein